MSNMKNITVDDENQQITPSGAVSEDVSEVVVEEIPEAGETTKKQEMNWGDLSAFGPVLPLGTDVLKKRPVYRFFKRLFDILLCSLALILLSPLLLVVALAIVIDDPKGGPIFVQTRVGKNGKTFRLYKFRSMVVNAEAILAKREKNGTARQNNDKKPGDPTYKDKNDDRITRVGRVIRKNSIDELPQIINVIKGDMSIVGPRPPLPKEVATYNDFSLQRLLIRPGLTCIWQTTRNRDEVPFAGWMKMDVTYIQHCGFFMDCKLILKTFITILRGDGH
jgi:Sugar transferases involved in lipopolysaccharide synthesis